MVMLVIVATAPLAAVDVVTICWVIDFGVVEVLVDLLVVDSVGPLDVVSDVTVVV